MKNLILIRLLFSFVVVVFFSSSCKKGVTSGRDKTEDSTQTDHNGDTSVINSPNVIKYATYNIQYGVSGSNEGEHPWSERKYYVENIFDKYNFDIVTIDEAWYSELRDIQSLVPGYAYYGSTTKGTEEDHIITVGILYKKDRFEIKDSGRFWLSSTPSVPSMSYGGHQRRICNWAFFKDKKLGTLFYVFSTHLSLARYGADKQLKEVKLIQDSILSIAKGYPTILSGDFNMTQKEDAYAEIAELGVLTDSYMVTEKHLTPYQGTSTKYGDNLNSSSRIDHIFLANCNNFKVLTHATLMDSYDGGKFGSDHNPVLINVIIPKRCKNTPIVKDTIEEDFKYAAYRRGGYLENKTVVAPSGLWLFDQTKIWFTDPENYRTNAPKLKMNGYIQNKFNLYGLKSIKVKFIPTLNVSDIDFKIEIQVSTDAGNTWSSLGTTTTQRGQIGIADFSPDIPENKNVLIRIINKSPETINILKVFIVKN